MDAKPRRVFSIKNLMNIILITFGISVFFTTITYGIWGVGHLISYRTLSFIHNNIFAEWFLGAFTIITTVYIFGILYGIFNYIFPKEDRL